jgi:hypothetical protein
MNLNQVFPLIVVKNEVLFYFNWKKGEDLHQVQPEFDNKP